VRGKLIEAFYPEGADGRIPTAMITGTFGKTTTTLMLASILASAGHTVGSATTESVKIADHVVVEGDFAGVDGASIVWRDPLVTAAVLETARGGLVKTGMYLDRCDVAALLNVTREQIEFWTASKRSTTWRRSSARCSTPSQCRRSPLSGAGAGIRRQAACRFVLAQCRF